MNWKDEYLPEAVKAIRQLDRSRQLLVRKAILKVLQNPLPSTEGGFGKSLGNRSGTDLSGLLKIKLRSDGLRIVYKLIREKDAMLVIVVGVRADDSVYKTAAKRKKKHDL